ncbi:type VI secretion system protein [Rhodoferax saidenbachensis]|uniref:Type VI secretion system protein ImpL n=1 Tax=Rhodoferax saidenbachensis TaxID=1484693 RepID=A0ABU1ZNJ6_9BURK|nr:type VI secretion system protein [Rhodoferax saidenbachensis]MDR7307127.1 type VI secretion system protein ImpL [Rhodoferax saidenbachensis]
MSILRDNLFLASLALLTLIVLAVLGLVLYFAMRSASAKPGSDPKLAKLRFDSLRNSFRQAVELIEGNIAARSERYAIPWVLVLNEGLEQRGLPIEQSGVPSALSSEAASAATSQGISWHFFDKGVVVEMQGAYLGSPDDENAAEKPWDEFLSLCHKYRPQRPFDSVVITVPAAMLMDTSPDAALELGKMARLAHRRLWLAQNRFAMRFAVYVAISGCEKIEGFASFARTLPEPMRAGMLGWSSPYDLSTTYQDTWVGEALDGVVRTISDTSAELFASKQTLADTRGFFLLPSRIEALRDQLQVYTDELMRPSAYHEPFFFRGIYFTGDSSQSAQTAETQFAEADAEPVLESLDTADLVSQLMQEPAFLRDLFEKKIFMEYGLARPSRQPLARPMLTRVGQFTAIVVLGGWSVGLVVATLHLDRRSHHLSATLQQIEADASYRTQKMRSGESIAPDWYKARTLTLLSVIEELGSQKMFSVFMPGSWPIWDNLDTRVVERVEREFGDIAIGTLRRELYARASELTGVPQDESTAELIIGGECVNPVPVAGPTHKAVLAVEDTAEFPAMLQYISSVERLEQAVEAMKRLQKGGANEANDLRLLVKFTLGAELPSNLSQSLRLLRGSDSGSSGSNGVSVMHMQQAVRCSLVKGMNALDQRVFVNNDLLVMERQLAALSYRLLSTDFRVTGFTQTVAGYKEILNIIREQENMLATGRGGWMHELNFDLGKAYAAALDRIAQATRLLGPEAAEQVRQRAVNEFLKFSSEFSARSNPEQQSDIVWQEKEARYGLSAQRLGLRDAIAGLLGQPFMTQPGDRDIPEIPAQGVLLWDVTKLDQALALGDLHKRFMAEGLLKFPPSNRPGVVAFLNAQFARLINDRIVDALSVSGRVDPANATDANAFDAARARLTKVEALLSDLGANTTADTLQRLVSADASIRLRQIDKSLNQSDLYAIRGRDFSYWTGDRGPLLQAFGVPDTQALQQYLALQFSRAETLGRQAEIYLPSLDKISTDGQLANRWQAINRELERYRSKNPNSSLGVYEQFLLTVGAETDRNTCTEKLAGKSPGSRPADYFAERYVQVYGALLKRCNELRYTEQLEQWSAFANTFNGQVAGRAPFAVPGVKDTIDADYEDVNQLLKTSEKLSRVLKDPQTASRTAPYSQSVRKFSDQFERVRAFLAPLYPPEDGMVPGYDVMVEFRANQAAEVEGNKVIDWSLDVGPQTIKLRDTPRLMRWEPGMPVTLNLRLAKDIPGNALPDPQQTAMAVDGKAVTYRFTDTWSLVRMVQRQREADPSGRGDLRTQLLRMEFPIGTGTEPGKGAQPDTRAKVYLRLTLFPVGKRTPMVWPVSFPVRAPEFNGQ